MGNNKELWLVVADSACARLLHGTATRHDHVHLDEVARLETKFVASEHGRPTRLSQPGRSGPTDHDHERRNASFASDLMPWIEKELQTRGIARCDLFAPSHLLGAMRAVGKGVSGKLTEHEGELAQLPAAELARHPRIVALLPS